MPARQTTLHIVGEDDRPIGPGLAEPWDGALAELERAVGERAVRRWLRPLRPVGIAHGRLSLAGSPAVVGWAAARYGELVLESLRKRIPELRSIELIPDRAGATEPAVRIGLPAGTARYRGWSTANTSQSAGTTRSGPPKPAAPAA